MPLTITADTKFITDYLDQVGKRIDDPAPLLDQIGMLMETRIRNRFETMTDPGGTKWAPWAESTKANYPDDGHGRLLDRYGDMLDGTDPHRGRSIGENRLWFGDGRVPRVRHQTHAPPRPAVR
ncbi:hypothetical protein MASR2M50_22010 [Thauera sp.]